jgi:hypothetical protein
VGGIRALEAGCPTWRFSNSVTASPPPSDGIRRSVNDRTEARHSLLDAGGRENRKLEEIRRGLEADVARVLGQPTYRRDVCDDDWRILPGTAAYVRAALLSLHAHAEIVEDDEDDVEAALRAVGR